MAKNDAPPGGRSGRLARGHHSASWLVLALLTFSPASANAAGETLAFPCSNGKSDRRSSLDDVPTLSRPLLRAEWFLGSRSISVQASSKPYESAALRDLTEIKSLDQPGWEELGPSVVLDGQIGLTNEAREVSGPVTAIAVDEPSDPKREKPVWLAGAAAGGIWRTEDSGWSWKAAVVEGGPVTMAIGALAFGPAGIAYAGTGNSYLLGSSGLLVSDLVLGERWKKWRLVDATIGADKFNWCGTSVSAISISPPQGGKYTIVIGLRSASPILFRSQETDSFGLFAAEVDPRHPETLHFRALKFPGTMGGTLPGEVWDLKASSVGGRWCLYAGVQTKAVEGKKLAGGLYRSSSCTHEHGTIDDWEHVPVREEPIIVAAVKIALFKDAVVYVSIFDAGGKLRLYRTDTAAGPCAKPSVCWSRVSLYRIAREVPPDGEFDGYSFGYCNWNPASPNPRQPANCRHSHTITVDPTDPDILYAGGIALWKCTNCKGTDAHWEDISYVTPTPPKGCLSPRHGIHVDQQAMAWAKETGKKNRDAFRLIVGNDGGVWSAQSPGSKPKGTCVRWENHNFGLAIAPIYRGALDPRRPGVVFAGTQDIGTIRRAAPRWRFVLGGDGVGVAVSHKDPATHWAVAHQSVLAGPAGQQFALQRTRDGGLTFQRADLGIDREEELKQLDLKRPGKWPEWVPPFVQCPDADSDVLLLGLRSLWKVEHLLRIPTTRAFETASPPAWTLDYSPKYVASKPDFPEPVNITAIAFAPKQGCEVYAVATLDGQVHLRDPRKGDPHKGSDPWQPPFRIPGLPDPKITAKVTALAFEPTDDQVLYATVANYGYRRHVLRWEKGNWTDITPPKGGGDGIDLPFLSIALTPAALFVGSDFGVFMSYERGNPGTWCWFGPKSGIPSVPVTDLKVHRVNQGVYAFTFGRGVFRLPDVAGAVCGCRKAHEKLSACDAR